MIQQITAFFLILSMALSASFSADTKVYIRTDGDFGTMSYAPDNGATSPYGAENVYIVTQASELERGAGTATLRRAEDDRIVGQWSPSDESVEIGPVSQSLVQDNTFTGGSIVCLHLGMENRLMEPGAYYVTMDEGFVLAGDTPISAIDKGDWMFTIIDYGFADERYSSGDSTYSSVGDTLEVDYVLGGDAAMLVIQPVTDNATVSETFSTQSGTCIITYTAPGEANVDFYFLDKHGEVLQGVVESVTVTED